MYPLFTLFHAVSSLFPPTKFDLSPSWRVRVQSTVLADHTEPGHRLQLWGLAAVVVAWCVEHGVSVNVLVVEVAFIPGSPWQGCVGVHFDCVDQSGIMMG